MVGTCRNFIIQSIESLDMVVHGRTSSSTLEGRNRKFWTMCARRCFCFIYLRISLQCVHYIYININVYIYICVFACILIRMYCKQTYAWTYLYAALYVLTCMEVCVESLIRNRYRPTQFSCDDENFPSVYAFVLVRIHRFVLPTGGCWG